MEIIFWIMLIAGVAIIADAAHESRKMLKRMLQEYGQNNDLPKV